VVERGVGRVPLILERSSNMKRSSRTRVKRSLPALEFRPTTTRHSCSRCEMSIKLDAVGLVSFLLFRLLYVSSGVLLLCNDVVYSVGGDGRNLTSSRGL
jgi:hypothetical protein